ncbi:MAG: hypothetical protein P4L27_10820 [Ignavibacteriaceae bacterium]|nr:hypothetical protein [Ignavibacteriaceae bacterium]
MALFNGCKKDSPTAPVNVTFTTQGTGEASFELIPSQASGTIVVNTITITITQNGTTQGPISFNPTQYQGTTCSYNSPFDIWISLSGANSFPSGIQFNITITGNVGSASGPTFTATTNYKT